MKTLMLAFCLLLSSTVESSSSSEEYLNKNSLVFEPEWDYEDKGPHVWPSLYKTCGGKRQSPINLDPHTSDSCLELQGFIFNGYSRPLRRIVITNTGESIRLDVDSSESPSFTGGGFKSVFSLIQFHFHWGDSDRKGSEHTLEREKYSMELHLVHNNTGGKTAVVSCLLAASNYNNPAFDPIIKHLDSVKKPGSSVQLSDPLVLRSLLPASTHKYFRYTGSLTTPPCTEGIIWTVFAHPVRIGSRQLQAFRKVLNREKEPLVNNFRPVQPLNGRPVMMSRGLGKNPKYCL